jgi:hypothetical protein
MQSLGNRDSILAFLMTTPKRVIETATAPLLNRQAWDQVLIHQRDLPDLLFRDGTRRDLIPFGMVVCSPNPGLGARSCGGPEHNPQGINSPAATRRRCSNRLSLGTLSPTRCPRSHSRDRMTKAADPLATNLVTSDPLTVLNHGPLGEEQSNAG